MDKKQETVKYLRHKVEQIEQKDPTKLLIAFYGSLLIAAMAMLKEEWKPLSIFISAIDLGYLADWGIGIIRKSQAKKAIITLEGDRSFERIKEKHPSTNAERQLYVPSMLPLIAVFVLGLYLDYHWLGLSLALVSYGAIVAVVLIWTAWRIYSSEQEFDLRWDRLAEPITARNSSD